MKSVLLLVLFVGLVSARYYHHFDRRAETTTEEPESTTEEPEFTTEEPESTTEYEDNESTTEAEETTTEETTTEEFAGEAASVIGPNCDEFAEVENEADLELHCGDDPECWKRAETCEFIMMCIEYGEMNHEEIAAKCGENDGCWRDVEDCAAFGSIEERVWRLERMLRRVAEQVKAISGLDLIKMMLKGAAGGQGKGVGGPGGAESGVGVGIQVPRKRTAVKEVEKYLLQRIAKELKNKH